MAMVKTFPEDYSHFVSTLILGDKLNKATITQAFHIEKIQRTRKASSQISKIANKASTSSLSSFQSKNHNYRKEKWDFSKPCFFCELPGYSITKCPPLLAAKQGKQDTIQESAGKASIYTLEQLDNPLSYKANFD